MKKKMIAFIICFCYQYAIAQNGHQKESTMYMAAYEYIICDSINFGRLISVSDSIVDLDRYWSSGLEEFPNEKNILNQYRSKKGYRYFDTYYSQSLDSLFHNRQMNQSNTILFFSQIEDCILRADLLTFSSKQICKVKKKDYNAYFWGTGFEYLFLFNANGVIKIVLRQEIIYN